MNTKSLETMIKTARVSFLQSTITAKQAEIALLPEGDAKNDAVLELNMHTKLLAAAKQGLRRTRA